MNKYLCKRVIPILFPKITLRMRLAFLLFFIALIKINARTYSQNTKISLELMNEPLARVFKEIKSKTEFSILYMTSEIDLKRNVSIAVKKQRIEFILDILFKNTNIVYKLVDRQIVLKKGRNLLKIVTPPPPVIQNNSSILELQLQISGVVSTADGTPLVGVNVLLEGTAKGTQTDFDGKYKIAAKKGDVLKFSHVGYKTSKNTVGSSNTINVTLEHEDELDEVVLVSFGKQKKASVVAAITTIKPAELKIPSSNLTTALAGRIAGIIAFQRSGEPGFNRDDATFFIRGVSSFGHAYANNPLILIDGVELTVSDLANLQPDDIESFSIMKDATATALYGARGANGVIYVTTKEGAEGPARISARLETSISSPTQNIEFSDAITYMELHNESVRTRDPSGVLPYSLEKTDKTKEGVNPILYPATNWQKELLNRNVLNKRFNLNLSGGGNVSRYYVSFSATKDNGILKVPKVSNFNNNINLNKFQLRSNINIRLTKTTGLKMAVTGSYIDYNGPLDSGAHTYRRIMQTNPVLFRPYYEKDSVHQYTKHILFGNYGNGKYINPYADMVKGYREFGSSKFISQIELKQDLAIITEGLRGKITVNISRESSNSVLRAYTPYFYQPEQDEKTGVVSLNLLNEGEGKEFLGYKEDGKDVLSSSYLESLLTYSSSFYNNLDVSGLLVFTLNNRVTSGAGALQASLPHRNMGLAGRFTVGYNGRYFTEFNFGYNGSERFAKKERWGFFPSIGLGWLVSKEKFFQNYTDTVDFLKLKATYGLVGNDKIGNAEDRFFYLSEVELENNTRKYTTGKDFGHKRNGVSIIRYANDKITWELAEKINFGVELGLFNDWNLEVDFFMENRSNILAKRIVGASTGLEADVLANIGEAKSKGVDGSLVYTTNFSNKVWLQARGNFTYSTNKITKIEEPDYSDTPWLSRVGKPIDQVWGYVAERLFVDQNEVNNSPFQSFGYYSGGDIKYRDINGDGKISRLDKVPIGNPSVPEIVYGFGISGGYKNIDLSFFFQGLTNESFWVNPKTTAPFIGSKASNNQLLKVWADNHWSENNRDVYAKWPRLSSVANNNNIQQSTWFMQDGSFLRLKSVELGYNLPKKILDKLKMFRVRIYITGNNILNFSKFKLWDTEMGGNGLGYPTQRVFNTGLHVSF